MSASEHLHVVLLGVLLVLASGKDSWSQETQTSTKPPIAPPITSGRDGVTRPAPEPAEHSAGRDGVTRPARKPQAEQEATHAHAGIDSYGIQSAAPS